MMMIYYSFRAMCRSSEIYSLSCYLLHGRDKSSLETQISKLKNNLEQKDGDLEGRYKRGDVIEQQLREERNSLENEVRRLKVGIFCDQLIY